MTEKQPSPPASSAAKSAPVGQRPRCLYCDRELRPNYDRPCPPVYVTTGERQRVKINKGFGQYEEREIDVTRPPTGTERRQWKKEHPPVWLGSYGDYRDNRFCGLRCGYRWAVAHSRPQNAEG